MIVTLRSEQVDLLWPFIADGMALACERTGGDLTAGYLWQECRSGRAFLVVSQDGAAVNGASVWRFETWQTGTKLRCLSAWGEGMDLWRDAMRAHVAAMQREGGANGVVAEGREGWKRVFPQARAIRTLYELDLNG